MDNHDMSSFTISETFDSPRAAVFDCWIKADVFEKWYPPVDCESKLIHADVREGGYYQQEDRWQDGTHCYIKHVFECISPAEKLAFVTSFCNAEGEIANHPFAASWPKRMLTTLTFEDDGAGTNISVLWQPVEACEEEVAFFIKILPSCHEGWKGTFSRLEGALKELDTPAATAD